MLPQINKFMVKKIHRFICIRLVRVFGQLIGWGQERCREPFSNNFDGEVASMIMSLIHKPRPTQKVARAEGSC